MKITLSVLSLLCLPALPLWAAPDSAYQALRVIGTARGQDVLNHVIEVQGRGGVPQPTLWRVVLDDPSSRGGTRELDVAHGKIVGEHTPVRAYSGTAAGAVINFRKLNLDSPGVFTVAEKEAQKSHLGFDSVDYTLRTGDGAESGPVWVVNLMNGSARTIGTVSVGADNGAIVSSELTGHPAEQDVAVTHAAAPRHDEYVVQETDHDSVSVTTEAEPPVQRQMDGDDTEDTQGLRVGHRIKQAILSAGGSLQNFFQSHRPDQ